MKKAIITIVIIIVVAFTSYSLYLVYRSYEFSHSTQQRVLIVYNKAYMNQHGYVLKAYMSVLEEEGVNFETVEIHSLIETTAKDLAQKSPVIIFPDGVAQSLPNETINWIEQYLANAGNIAVIYDAGIKTPKGYFLDNALFADIIGINYIMFSKLKEKAYTTGSLKFTSQQIADSLQIPPGKTDRDLFFCGYIYGKLTYPMARNEYMQSIPESSIFASIITEQGEKYPAIVHNRYGNGNIMYVNLPLGYLKANSDDLPLRALLRTFLFQIVKIPHLINAEQGKAGLVINWHIDSNLEWANILARIKDKHFNKDLRYSIHITAGDFRDHTEDQLGFDACGRGKKYVKLLLPYGTIGSHGGWAHNWFAENIEKGKLSEEEITLYIKKNKTCLESLTNYPVVEYSAPVGLHPQPSTTKILEKLGFTAYYYTGDNGSAPNRTFSKNVMVSSKVVAFPIITNDKSASLYEMKENKLPGKEVEKWLIGSIDYLIENRTTRVFYSHLHDISDYPNEVNKFIQYAKRKQTEGKLRIEPMTDFARFFHRFLETNFSFQPEGKNLIVYLQNEKGLKGMTVAIPCNRYKLPEGVSIMHTADENYDYVTVNEDVQKKSIFFTGI